MYAGKFEGIYAVGIGMIVRPGIFCQDFCQCFVPVGRKLLEYGVGNLHLQGFLLCCPFGKSS